ncbi:MAG TPA: SDR family NAD(P)-dependent oxidoreductase, partial [Puia sp.]|nr:SDR family NAD(P)-dependent oxidoreductase [Puia sp.]
MVRSAGDNVNDLHYLMSGVGDLWLHGTAPDWNALYQMGTRRKISLPAYPFERTRYPVYVDAFRMLTEIGGEDHLQKLPDVSDWLYVPSWKLIPPIVNTVSSRHEGYTLLFADDPGIIRAIGSTREERGQKWIYVTAGDSYCKKADDAYELDPGVKDHFTNMVADLAAHGRMPDRLVHTGDIFSLVETVQAVQQHGGMAGMRVIVLTNELHPILDNGHIAGPGSMTPALLNVLSQEFQNVRTTHIDISLSESGNDAFNTGLCKEIEMAETGAVISLRHGRRWQQVFHRAQPAGTPTAIFREGGVYLITGGLGSVGFSIATNLVVKYHARVVLLGRTTLPPAEKWVSGIQDPGTPEPVRKRIEMLQQLKAAGGEVSYLPCNVGNVAALAAAVRQCEDTFGKLNGIVHAAGIVEGSSIAPVTELTRERFDAQFEPKIKGLQALKEVAGYKELDFCLIVSSLSAVLGGIGFGAYAPANAFMDHYIRAHKAQGALNNWISVNFDGIDPGKSNTGSINGEELIAVLHRVLAMKEHPGIIVSTSDVYKRIDKWITRKDNAKEDRFPGDELPVDNELPAAFTDAGDGLSDGSGPVIKTMLVLWQNFFGRPDISTGEDFFEAGGDSLKALTMIGRIHKTFNIEIPIKEFFNHSSVAGLARYITRIKAGIANQKGYADYRAIPKAPIQDRYPLSSAQKRLYFLYEFDRASLAYNLPQVIHIKGAINIEIFNHIINVIVSRHEILRTYVDIADGVPVQRIAGQLTIATEYFCVSAQEAPAIIQEFIRPFDLNKGPLIRTGLIEIAGNEYVFMIDMHHFISDGVSLGIFLKEFMTLYKGNEPGEVPLQYRDYAVWQTSEIYQQAVARERNWWLQEFSEEIVMLDLPLDHERPMVRNYEGATVHFLLTDAELGSLRRIADAEGVTLFMVILSVYSILLGKLAGQDDVVIGTPTSGRNHADLEQVMGMLVNTVAIRTHPNGALRYRDFLAQLKSKTLTVFDQQAYPYELLIEEVNVARDTSRNPLFDVWFVYQNWEGVRFELPGLDITPRQSGPAISQFDLSLTAGELNGNMLLNFEYSTELFKQQTIERFIAYFRTIIGAIGSDTDRTLGSIALVKGAEQQL